MGRHSRDKGARLEREFVSLLESHGIEATRNLAQYQESDGRDLTVNVPICVQIKGGARPNAWTAIQEAIDAIEDRETPIAAIRRDRWPWLLVMRADDALPMIAFWYAMIGAGGPIENE